MKKAIFLFLGGTLIIATIIDRIVYSLIPNEAIAQPITLMVGFACGVAWGVVCMEKWGD